MTASGAPRWDVEQIPVSSERRADPDLAALIRETQARYLAPEDREVVAHLPAALAPAEAARAVAAALRRGAGADAASSATRHLAADCRRGTSRASLSIRACASTARSSSRRSTARGCARLLAAANQGVDTPFEHRGGEFNVADGPATLDDATTYRIATTDWGAKNSARYFGEPAIVWQEQSGSTLKTIVLRALTASR